MPIKNRFAELLPQMTAWRRDFHQHPELLYDLPRTSTRVAELLAGFGVDEIVTGIAQTGVVAVIKGRSDSRGRVIGLRADMDALPIHEATGAAYASTSPGKMHACGHDGHTSMLLGAAQYLAETRNFDGTVVCIFQPAEEGGGGGRAMVAEGLMTRFGIDEVYALHNMPGIPVGAFAMCEGPIMGAADQFEIVVHGKGGHAAKPHDCIDTTLVAAQIVVAAQSIASRNVDPLKQVVVSICTVSTDSTAHNVIPQQVVMKGTVRTMDRQVQAQVESRLGQIVEGVALAFGARAELRYHYGYPVTINPPETLQAAAEVARMITPEVDTRTAPLMAAEDFSFMLNERPGAYIFMGNGDTAMIHSPGYDFDDSAMPYGASWLAGIAEARMPVS